MGQLLEDGGSDDFIKGLILSVRSLIPIESLVEECEKRYPVTLKAIPRLALLFRILII